MLGLITLNRYLGLGKLKSLSISAAEHVATDDIVKEIGEIRLTKPNERSGHGTGLPLVSSSGSTSSVARATPT